MSQPNILDRVIGVFAPEAYAKRMEARVRAGGAQMLAAYQGATQSYRTSSRTLTRADANTEIRASLSRLRDVHRDMVRNNPYAARAVGARVTNTVGSGITPSIVGASKRGKALISTLVSEHLETTAIDFDGLTNLYGLQAQAERARSESGEALIIRVVPTAAKMKQKNLKLPLQLRVLEADYLDHTKHGPIANGYIFMGVEFDMEGDRVAYWLHDQHPNSVEYGARRFMLSRRVPASEVIHYYHPLRPGQVRGIPDGTPVIITAGDLVEYADARIMREKIAACFSMFWTRGDTSTHLASGAKAADQSAGFKIRDLAPGLIQELPQGAEVTFGQPPATTGHAEFITSTVRTIAIGYDLSFEEVSGDLTKVSFLSGRLGEIHMSRRVEQWQWHWLIPMVCGKTGEWFADAVSIVARPGTFSLQWTPPRREMLSPKDEIPARRDAIRAGLTSRQAEIRRMGEDPEQVDRENAEDNARADLAKLEYDSDGRRPRQGPNISVTETITPEGAP